MDVPVLFVIILYVGHVQSWSGSEYYNGRYSVDGINYDVGKLCHFFETAFIFIISQTVFKLPRLQSKYA